MTKYKIFKINYEKQFNFLRYIKTNFFSFVFRACMKVATWIIRKNTWPSLAGYSNFVSYTVSSYLHSRIKYFYYLYLQKYVNNCYRWNIYIYIKRPIFHTFEGCHGNYSLLGNLRPVRGVPWSSCSGCSFSFENYQEIIQTKWAIKFYRRHQF